jgi:heme exporter protein C
MKRSLYIGATAVVMLLLGWTLWSVFYRTDLDETLFFSQKIFYYHVPHAMLLFALVFACGISSAGFLKNRKGSWDDVAVATGEVAVVYGAIVLTSGSIWGHAAWGKWWVWDMRLTTSLLLWLLMVGYVLVRRFGGAGAERLAAGLAVFAMVDVPLIYFSVQIWNTLHPKAEVVSKLQPGMRGTYWLSVLTVAILCTLVIIVRVALARNEREFREVREQALDAGILEG